MWFVKMKMNLRRVVARLADECYKLAEDRGNY
jgi:hypothetical protein